MVKQLCISAMLLICFCTLKKSVMVKHTVGLLTARSCFCTLKKSVMVKPVRHVFGYDVVFLYSQEISNGKTVFPAGPRLHRFLYSQEISNGKTATDKTLKTIQFLYSQEISNGKT